MMSSFFYLEDFRPAKRLVNAHLQTAAGRYGRCKEGIVFHRRRLNTPDGDFVDIDFPEVAGYLPAETAPIVLVLHGLEGSARASYAYDAYRQLAQRGIRAVGLNYRSCSGTLNQTAYTYHAGFTDDVHLVVQQLAAWFPAAPLGAIGFSLGANILLKYLGEQGRQCRLQTAVAISPPFFIERSIHGQHQAFSHVYGRYFMRALRRKIAKRAPLLADKVDVAQLLQAQTFRELDQQLTIPLYGFRDLADYWQQCSSGHYVADIGVPTLIIRSLDDPVFDPMDVPYSLLRGNKQLTAVVTPHGGHVGFAAGEWGQLQWWAERQAARFLAAHFGLTAV